MTRLIYALTVCPVEIYIAYSYLLRGPHFPLPDIIFFYLKMARDNVETGTWSCFVQKLNGSAKNESSSLTVAKKSPMNFNTL